MRIGEVYGGKFIKATTEGELDIPGKPYEMVVTIKATDITEFKADKAGEEPRKQITVEFEEIAEMSLGLNVTNARSIAVIVGSDDTDDWPGKQIELCTVPEERSTTGHAVRIRKPRKGAAAKAPAETPVLAPLGKLGAGRLTDRLKKEGREIMDLRGHLADKFPQFTTAISGNPEGWPSELGTAIAAWFAKPAHRSEPLTEESIPF